MQHPGQSPVSQDYDENAGWRAIIILLLLYALSIVDRQVLNLMVDPIKRDLGISDVQMGLLQGFAFATFYTLCGFPLGWAADRFNRRLLIFGGVLVWALATVACGLARSYEELLIARFAVGAGEAALMPAAYSILSDLFPKRRLTQAMSVFSVGSMIGAGLALMLGGLVVGYATSRAAAAGSHGFQSWQRVFLLIGLPGIPMAFLIFLFPEPKRAAHDQQQGDEPLLPFLIARRTLLLRHFFGFSLICLVSYAINAWVPTYLSRSFSIPMAQIGIAYGVAALIFGTGGFLGSGYIVGRAFGRGMHDAHFHYPAYGALWLGLGACLAILSPSPWLAILLFGLCQLFTTVAAVAAAVLQLMAPPHLRGRVTALYLLVFNMVGAGLGPLSVALVADHLLPTKSLGTAIATICLTGCSGAFLLLWSGKRALGAELRG